MNRCAKCLMPDTRPDTPFIDGVCSACVTHENRKEIDWAAKERELVEMLEKMPRNGTGYDCIVPSSGGKDSTWQVVKLKELGVRPLVVTAETCHLTRIGAENIDNLARLASTLRYVPNKSVRARLNLIGLTTVGDISWPEHVSIFTTPFKAAVQTGIPLIFYGECPQAIWGGPLGTEENKRMTRRWVSEYGGFLGMRPEDMIGQCGITEEDMRDYMPPSDDDIEVLGVEAFFLGQFCDWDSHRNAEVAITHGMKYELPCHTNYWEWENLDNAQTGIHDHLALVKYGYSRGTVQLSADIRLGLISREDALPIAEFCEDKFPYFYGGISHQDILARIDMTPEEYLHLADQFTNWDMFRRVDDCHTHKLMRV